MSKPSIALVRPPQIEDIAREANACVQQRWRTVIEQHRRRLAWLAAGDCASAREAGLRLLLRPVAARLARGGLEVYPSLPGADPWDTTPPMGSDQAWYVAAICTAAGEPVGTLVTVAAIEACAGRLLDVPAVFGLRCVGVQAVRRELQRGPELSWRAIA